MTDNDVLTLFDGIRVADVRDGMDAVGLQAKGTLPRQIRPLFRGARVCGRAFTVRSRPSDKSAPAVDPEEYTRWAHEEWYGKIYSSRVWTGKLQPGDVVVIEGPDLGVGEVGSNNSLGWHARGAVGVITSGGVRDTDECVRQGVPIFARYVSQSTTHARVELDDHQVPITLGDVVVRPGDIVVGDGDGVIAVPMEKAAEVATYARRELETDKVGRRQHYEALGWELDETVL